MRVETTKEKIGIEVYADTLGPMQVHSIHGNRFAVHFTDAYSRFRGLSLSNRKVISLNALLNSIKYYCPWEYHYKPLSRMEENM
jgi:hypothetical protein